MLIICKFAASNLKLLFMKKNVLVYVLLYNGSVLNVCRTRSFARLIARQYVVDSGCYVDKFEILELPLSK